MFTNTENQNNTSKKVTGLVKAKQISLINPTLAELKSIGLNFKDEPVYTGKNRDDVPYVNITIWLSDGVNKAPIRFQIYNKIATSLKDPLVPKTQWFDAYGNTAWFEDKSPITDTSKTFGDKTFKTFDAATGQKCPQGFADFLAFMKNLHNTKSDSKLTIDISKLLKGDFSEIRATPIPKNDVWVAFVVKNLKYQEILNQWSYRGFKTQIDAAISFKKYVDNQASSGHPLKDAWSVELKEYVEPKPTVNTTATQVSSPKVDDLPF